MYCFHRIRCMQFLSFVYMCSFIYVLNALNGVVPIANKGESSGSLQEVNISGIQLCLIKPSGQKVVAVA